LLPQDVLEGFAKRNLIFDSESQSGIAFHLLGSLSEHGKVPTSLYRAFIRFSPLNSTYPLFTHLYSPQVGITCVGDTAEAATALFTQVQKVLEELGSSPRFGAKEPMMPKKEMLAVCMTAQGEKTTQVCSYG
jgi:hypothetical protein